MSIVDNDFIVNPLNVPEKLPVILKQFCKAAIRTQPYDLLKWSCAYFNALAEGFEPPTKIRLEYPLPRRASSLTLGLLKILLRQFGDYNKLLSLDIIARRWHELCLNQRDFNLIVIIGRFKRICLVKKFLAIAAGLLGANLFDTMLIICELFTVEPDGGSAMIPLSLFAETYEYLANLRCDGEKKDQNHNLSKSITDNCKNVQSESVDYLNKDFINSEEVSDSTNLDTDENPYLNCDSLSKDDSSSTQPNFVGEEESIGADSNDKKIRKEEDSSESAITLMNCDSIIVTSENRSDGKDELIESNQNFDIDPKWISSHYPLVPGIGPQLTVEEITSVIEWVTECAHVQEDMIGPRNLRHFQCPPLDRHNISNYK